MSTMVRMPPIRDVAYIGFPHRVKSPALRSTRVYLWHLSTHVNLGDLKLNVGAFVFLGS